MLKKGWIPCLEFDEVSTPFIIVWQFRIASKTYHKPSFSCFHVRWDMYLGRTARFQATTTGGIGHCGSCQCSGAMMPLKSWMRFMSARKRTQMLISAAWHLTMSTRVSAWPLSFKNPPAAKAFQLVFLQKVAFDDQLNFSCFWTYYGMNKVVELYLAYSKEMQCC